jgi:uncharacterized protein involved in type VI secretion and phage assembly
MAVLYDHEEFDRIWRKLYHPNDKIQKMQYRPPEQCKGWQQGIVVDNKDPMCLGKLRVHFPMWGKDCITGWIPCAGIYRDKDQGFWGLPNIGDRVICAFINYDPDRPVVTGTFYTKQNRAPVSGNKGNYRKIFSSRECEKKSVNRHSMINFR